ncbi:ARM REPEAT PROTEIN INTERACTING WITH ABF2-like [Durio zibethinus]|uniref:ARM REPEAT PROTEIN INTERACTING WITH ABF2-like n=1 Tax=Durio zibethinus TaxID=66656 RepID=A0A6P5X9N5_DURZI|nr:ARM REPEAT PROTEIN INTERACTING WITH ABF2-like [Durio zibethinus]
MVLVLETKMQIQELWDLISLGEEVCLAVNRAKSFKVECGELEKRVNRLLQMLQTLFCFITSGRTSLYLRPVTSIVAKVKDSFELVRAILYKCKRRSLLSRLFLHLDASISDMEWLLIVYNPQNSRATGPIDHKISTTFLVWSCIATVQMGCQLDDRIEATKCLQLLAQENNEYKKIIFEEGGVPPLQKLLKENVPVEAQITVANALCLLADDQERARIIMKEMITTIVNRLSRTSPMSDQSKAANLVASIAEHNPKLKEYVLVRENVIWRLVTLLSSEPSRDNPTTNLHKQELKISCSKALWMLARGSVSNCRTLTETKGMFCLAKLVETEQDELQYNCLMIIREITAIAESNNDFRHSAFKSTSPAAKAVVDELLRIIKEFDNTKLRIPALESIGSLARSFSAKETRVISHLVTLLGNSDQEVAMEAAIALQKFVSTDNHLCSEHSKSIIEFNGVRPLMKLIFSGDKKLQHNGLALICFLAQHGSNSNVLIEAGALSALQMTGTQVAAEHPELKQLVSDTISKLQPNHTEKNEELDSSPKGSIKQIMTERNNVVFGSLRHHLKLLLQRFTPCLPRLVNFHGDRKTLPIVMRYCLGHRHPLVLPFWGFPLNSMRVGNGPKHSPDRYLPTSPRGSNPSWELADNLQITVIELNCQNITI